MLDDQDEFGGTWVKTLRRLQPIEGELCRILHTRNIGLSLFLNSGLMKIYLKGCQKRQPTGGLELAYERIKQAYKRFKNELDELHLSANEETDQYWLERYVNNALQTDTFRLYEHVA